MRAVAGDPDGSLWLGFAEGGGLAHFDRDGRLLARFQPVAGDPLSLPSPLVRHVLRRMNGELWVATNGGGLARMRDDGGFDRLRERPVAQGGLPSRVVTRLMESRDGTLWVGTEDAGLWRRCADCATFERIGGADRAPAERLPDGRIMDLVEGRDGAIWVGWFGDGVTRLDATGRPLEQFDRDSDPALPGAVVAQLLPDPDRGVWIAHWGAGLARLRPQAGHWQVDAWGPAAGLRSDTLAGLLRDGDGTLWISHGRGIDRFDPTLGRALPLGLAGGIDRTGYYPGSAWREPDGRLDFGGWSGWMRFRPGDVQPRRSPLTPHLTGLALFNRPVLPQPDQPDALLSADLDRLQRLQLPYSARMFSIAFAALDYPFADSTRYRFRLQGFDADWIDASASQRVATYANPPPGHYRLLVEAATPAGDFGPGVSLPIDVLPPWWRTPVALVGWTLLALLLLAGWLRGRFERARAKRAAVAEISRSRAQLAGALWGSRDELWDLDLERGTIDWQNRFEHIDPALHAHYPSYDAFLTHVHPDDADQLRQCWQDHMAGRTPYFQASYRVRSRAGDDWVWLLSRGQITRRDGAGRPLQAVGTNSDISDLKRVEARLREINETLEQRVEERTEALSAANERLSRLLDELRQAQRTLIEQEKMASLGGLVAGVAHELNTPLGIALTATSAMHEPLATLEQRLAEGRLGRSELEQIRSALGEAVAITLRSLERAGTLIASFKQVAVDQTSERKRRFDLAALLGDVALSMQPQCRRAGCQLQLDIEPGIELDAYPGAIVQIVTNLIGNALRHAFSERGGTITMRGRRSEDQVELTIADDGIGMAPEVAARAFEPFFTTRRHDGGSGLGLHICYNLATRMLGGTLQLTSRPGVGSEFVLRVPRVAPDTAGDLRQALRTTPPSAGTSAGAMMPAELLTPDDPR